MKWNPFSLQERGGRNNLNSGFPANQRNQTVVQNDDQNQTINQQTITINNNNIPQNSISNDPSVKSSRNGKNSDQGVQKNQHEKGKIRVMYTNADVLTNKISPMNAIYDKMRKVNALRSLCVGRFAAFNMSSKGLALLSI